MTTAQWTRMLVILLTVLVALVLAASALWIALRFIAELLVLAVAAIVAYLLTPVVDGLQRRVQLPRPLCILLVYALIGGALAAVGSLFVPPIEEQARALQAQLPELLRQLDLKSAGVDQFLRSHGIDLPLRGVAGNAAGAIGGAGPTVLGGALTIVGSISTGLLDLVLVAVIAFYLVHDRDAITRALAAAVPARYAAGAAFAAGSAGQIVGRYVRAQLAVAAMVGLLGGAGAAVLGVRYAPLIGIFAFLAESIPVLGPIIATVPAVVVALLESPWKAAAVLLWFVVVQQLEQNVIMPRLSGHAVGIHPVVAIMAVLMGFDLAGIWGALFAVPVIGYMAALAREARRAYAASRESTVGAGAPAQGDSTHGAVTP